MKSTLDQAVDRFLAWKLPENFDPDCGISFTRYSDFIEWGGTKYEPTGTNLFDAQQTKAMLSHVTEPIQAEIDELRAALLESKDVGLRLLTCRSLFSLARGEINAQRKVLEQALEANAALRNTAPVQAQERKPLTEFERMQIIGEEFPLPLVEPIIIQKIDSVCLAIEAKIKEQP